MNETAEPHERSPLDLVMHVPLELTARLGRCRLSIAELLRIGIGSVIELDRAAGAPVDLLANEELVARGEIVAVDDNVAVRVTELVARGTGG